MNGGCDLPLNAGQKTGKILKTGVTGEEHNRTKFGDKIVSEFYIIWREGRGAGFFSIISTILGHIRISEAKGLTPVVDMENHPNAYIEKDEICGTKNSFEYYFKPMQKVSLNEIYQEGKYELSSGQYPNDFTMSISTDPSLLDIWKKYFVLNETTSVHIDTIQSSLKIDSRTLGVHFRGQEMRRAALHPLPMTVKQAIAISKGLLESGNYDRIFLVTEGSNYLKKFKHAFPGKVIHTSAFRSFIWNSYKIRARKHHRYKLGLEILTDTILLSKCGGLISGSSNVSEMAILLNNGEYAQNIQVRNGRNSKNRLFAKFYWYLMYLLPKKFGGLPKSNL